MADDRQPRKSRPASSGGRGEAPRSSSGRSATGRPAAGRPAAGRSGGDDKPYAKREGGKPASRRDDGRGGPRRSGESRPFSRDRRADDRRADDRRPPRTDVERTEDQKRYDGPDIPEWITGKELDRSVADQLKSLPEKLMLRVARHLVAAGELLDSDPKTAYQHTLAARGRAGRLAVVREAVGEAAYAAGDYAEALAELRSAKRMNGAQDYIAIMADCERALGRPDRALTLLKNASRENFAPPLLAEVLIVEAGARRDRGELDAALRTLENGSLNSKSRAPWVARLRYAYAETLLAAGRREDALEWFHRTEAVDVEEITDAGARALEIERSLPKD
ncbi:MAG: tetratricopeptide repeat protein [Marmoricola sp.]